MGILKSIVDKFKAKELFAIVFIAGIIFCIAPKKVMNYLQLYEIRQEYQKYVSIGLLVIGSFYIYRICIWIYELIRRKRYSTERLGIKYMREHMNIDEKRLLVEIFYDMNENRFNASGYIRINDGRKAGLVARNIIYRAANVSYYTSFAYNLQPYALEFLNSQLLLGKIEVHEEKFKFDLE